MEKSNSHSKVVPTAHLCGPGGLLPVSPILRAHYRLRMMVTGVPPAQAAQWGTPSRWDLINLPPNTTAV